LDLPALERGARADAAATFRAGFLPGLAGLAVTLVFLGLRDEKWKRTLPAHKEKHRSTG